MYIQIKVDIKFVTDVQTGKPRIWFEGGGRINPYESDTNAILKAEVNEKETFGVLIDLSGKYFVKVIMEHRQPQVWEGTVTGGTFKGQNINPKLEMTRVIKDGDSIQVALDVEPTPTSFCVIA